MCRKPSLEVSKLKLAMPGILKIHLLYDQKHLDVILGQCTNANDVERRRNDTDLAIINALLDQGRCNCPMASCIRQEAMENFVFPEDKIDENE